jgi:hypothetical protein
VGCQFLGCLVNISQVCITVATPGSRGANGQKDRIRTGYCTGYISCEPKAFFIAVFGNQRIQSGLINRNFAVIELFYYLGKLVHTGNVVAEFGKTGSRYQPDIAGTYHCNIH